MLSETSIVVRSGDYMTDSFSVISDCRVETCQTENRYYITYYLNKSLENKKLDILRLSNGSAEVAINIKNFNKDTSIYYRDASGVYLIKLGNEDSWAKYWAKYLLKLNKERLEGAKKL